MIHIFMEIANVLLGGLLYMIIIVFIIYIFLYIFFSSKEVSFKKFNTAILIASYLLGIGYHTMKEYWGSDTIGSFFSKQSYTTKYYVNMFPEGSKSKNYKVPAELHVTGKELSIYKVWWPNGGYLTFDNEGDAEPEMFYEDKEISISDDEDREWTIILTDEKIK